MKITEITYSMGETIQVVKFEPVSTHFSAKAEVSEGEDIMEAYDQLAHIVNQRVGAERLKWKNPQTAARALQNAGKDELARQVLKKKEDKAF